MKARVTWQAFWISGLLLCTATALAGSNPAAEALFDSGRAAMERGDFDTACAQFQESGRLEPAVGTTFNLANCEEQRGRIATAWALYKSVVSGLDAQDKRLPFAKDKLTQLEPRVPKLTLTPAPTAPKNIRVKIGDSVFTSSSFNVPLPMDPGTLELNLSATGHQPKQVTLVLAEGESRTYSFTLESTDSQNPAKPVVASNEQPQLVDTSDRDAAERRRLGYVIGGIGVVGLATGAVLGVLVLKYKKTADENCWPPDEEWENGGCYPEGNNANENGKAIAPWTTVALSVGVVGLGVGGYLVISNPDEGDQPVALSATPIHNGALFSLEGRF